MPPPKKRKRNETQQSQEEEPVPSVLLSDNRASWLAKSDDQMVQLVGKGETLHVHRFALTKHSEYFEKALKEPWDEATKGKITFDNIESNSLALFVGVAYTHSSMINIQPPNPVEAPQVRKDRTPMRDMVEVLKLCDRFICKRLTIFMMKCLHVAILDGHRAMLKADADEGLQKGFMKDFADGYEALEQKHPAQKDLARNMIDYFVGGIAFDTWAKAAEEVLVVENPRPRFVGAVSLAFATHIASYYRGPRKRRKELPAIKFTE